MALVCVFTGRILRSVTCLFGGETLESPGSAAARSPLPAVQTASSPGEGSPFVRLHALPAWQSRGSRVFWPRAHSPWTPDVSLAGPSSHSLRVCVGSLPHGQSLCLVGSLHGQPSRGDGGPVQGLPPCPAGTRDSLPGSPASLFLPPTS